MNFQDKNNASLFIADKILTKKLVILFTFAA